MTLSEDGPHIDSAEYLNASCAAVSLGGHLCDEVNEPSVCNFGATVSPLCVSSEGSSV